MGDNKKSFDSWLQNIRIFSLLRFLKIIFSRVLIFVQKVLLVIFLLFVFQKVHKIYSRLIYNIAIFEKYHFLPYGEPTGVLFFAKGVFCLFRAYGTYIFLKNIKFAIDFRNFGNFDFSPYGEPSGGHFAHTYICTVAFWLSLLMFMIALM